MSKPRQKLLVGAACAVAFGLVGMLAPSVAQAQVLTTDLPEAGTSTAVTVTMTWTEPAHVEATRTGDEFVLRVSQPILYAAFRDLAPRLQEWVLAADFGYDSMVMRLAPCVVARAETQNGAVLLHLRLGDAPAAETLPETTGGAQRRLRFLKAAVLWARGETWEASQTLAELAAVAPKDADVATAQVAVETRQDRWRAAAQAADRVRGVPVAASGQRPVTGSAQVPEAMAQWLHDDQGGQIWRDGARAWGHAFLTAGWRATGQAEFARWNVSSGSSLAPSVAQLGDTNVQGGLGLRYDALSGSWLALRAVGTTNGFGAVAQAELWDRVGATQLLMSVAEPRWELPSLTAIGAERAAVVLSRTVRAWPALSRVLQGEIQASLSGTLERWTSQRDPGPVTDFGAHWSLRYATWFSRPRLALTWSGQHLEILNDSPSAAAPQRELGALVVRNHIELLTLSAELPLWRWLQLRAFGGYGWSIWGNNPVQYGGELTWQPPSGLRALVNYQQGITPESHGATLSVLRVQLGVSF